MHSYVIYTDSTCDITPELMKKWGVMCVSMFVSLDNEEIEYNGKDNNSSDFYSKMRDGCTVKTAAANPAFFANAFERVLEQGKDILYLGLSGSLSTTYNSARIAANELCLSYPERKIITIDTLSASAGMGMLVYLAVQKKNNGASLEETATYIEDIKLKICHWFVVDNLDSLKRGGRINTTLALVGEVLGIKPILHVDNDGKPVFVKKVRGKKAALSMLVDKYGELAENVEDNTVYIAHADNKNDSVLLKNELMNRYGIDVRNITEINPVIGAHLGPGAFALFFVGKQR